MSNYIICMLVAAVKVFGSRTVLEIASFSMVGSNCFFETEGIQPKILLEPHKASNLIWSQLISNLDSNLCPNSRRSREQKPTESCTRLLGHSPGATVLTCSIPQRSLSHTVCTVSPHGKVTRAVCRYWAHWMYQPRCLPHVQDCHFDFWCAYKCSAPRTLHM